MTLALLQPGKIEEMLSSLNENDQKLPLWKCWRNRYGNTKTSVYLGGATTLQWFHIHQQEATRTDLRA